MGLGVSGPTEATQPNAGDQGPSPGLPAMAAQGISCSAMGVSWHQGPRF